jgi:hypothetical protein
MAPMMAMLPGEAQPHMTPGRQASLTASHMHSPVLSVEGKRGAATHKKPPGVCHTTLSQYMPFHVLQ